MCNEAVTFNPYQLDDISDHFKNQGIREWVVNKNPCVLEFVPDHFETQKMCDDALMEDSCALAFVPDWFVTQQQIDKWYDDDYVYNDSEMIEWYEGYKKRKAPKTKIKEELLPIAWYSDCVKDWRMSGDEKRWWK